MNHGVRDPYPCGYTTPGGERLEPVDWPDAREPYWGNEHRNPVGAGWRVVVKVSRSFWGWLMD